MKKSINISKTDVNHLHQTLNKLSAQITRQDLEYADLTKALQILAKLDPTAHADKYNPMSHLIHQAKP